MYSPWINGSQGEQYTVPGLAGLLADNNQRNGEAMQQFSRMAGALGAGAVGAFQGAANPGVFGGDTTPAGGAARAGLMNFASSYNGGGSGFGRLVNGGGGNGVGGSGSMNFKQFAAMGKAADGVRGALAASTPSLPDEQPKVMGYTDDEWKHLGTADKMTALQSWQQGQTAKTQIQAYDMGQLHMKQAQDQLAAEQQQRDAWKQFGQNYSAATAPTLNTGDLTDFANYGKLTYPQVDGRAMQDMALRSGVNASDALNLAKSSLDVAKGEAQLKQEKVANVPSDWTNPKTGRNYTLFGNTILPSRTDEEITTEATAKAAAVSGNARLRDIGSQLAQLYKTPNWASKPDVMKKISALEAERNGLFSGAPAGGAAPADPADPLGLFSK